MLGIREVGSPFLVCACRYLTGLDKQNGMYISVLLYVQPTSDSILPSYPADELRLLTFQVGVTADLLQYILKQCGLDRNWAL